MTTDELAGICSRLLEVNMQLMTATKGVEMLEIQEVTEKHESEPYEGEEEYGKGMKHLRGSRESLPEKNSANDGMEQLPSPPENSSFKAVDSEAPEGSESVDMRSPLLEIGGATLTSSLDHNRSSSPKIEQAVIIHTESDEEQEKDESSVASDDTMKAGSVTDDYDFELLSSLKEESVDDPEMLDLPTNPLPTIDPLPQSGEGSQEGDVRYNTLVVPTIEIEADTDNEEGGGEGLSVVPEMTPEGDASFEDDQEIADNQEGVTDDQEMIVVDDDDDEPEAVSDDGPVVDEEEETKEEEIWQRQSSSQEMDIDNCTDL